MKENSGVHIPGKRNCFFLKFQKYVYKNQDLLKGEQMEKMKNLSSTGYFRLSRIFKYKSCKKVKYQNFLTESIAFKLVAL